MATPQISLDEAKRTIEAIEDLLKKGYRPPGRVGRGEGAVATAAPLLDLSKNSMTSRLRAIKRVHNLEPDWSLYKVPEIDQSKVPPPAAAPGSDVDMARQGWAPDFDITHEVPTGLTLKGTSIRYNGEGTVEQYWNKTRAEGRLPEETVQLPDPKKITKVSTLYDQTGRVTQQWVAEKPEDAQREHLWREFAKALAEEVPPVDPVKPPAETMANLMACYPVGDHHFGMLAWGEETGANYDISIAERLLSGAMTHLVRGALPADRAVIPLLGDFMHYDSFVPVTPTSRNQLDADGRFPKMVRAAMSAVRRMVTAALERHREVLIIVEIGNHDLAGSIFLMEALAALYENEPRVTVNRSPRHFHYFHFGKCLVGIHHGHGVKMDQLPLIMATDLPDLWGKTEYRYWWTGHIHHDKSKRFDTQDFAGCRVESFRVLAAADAWHANEGYRAARDMKAIMLHKDFGEVGRNIVNPAMLETGA